MKNTFYKFLPGGDPANGMGPSDLTPPDAFTTEDHTETIHTFFETDDASITTGVWECAPCKEEIDSYPVHEMMTVISGALTLTNEDGQQENLKSGDAFFIAKGSKLTWHITEKLRKFYMIAE